MLFADDRHDQVRQERWRRRNGCPFGLARSGGQTCFLFLLCFLLYCRCKPTPTQTLARSVDYKTRTKRANTEESQATKVYSKSDLQFNTRVYQMFAQSLRWEPKACVCVLSYTMVLLLYASKGNCTGTWRDFSCRFCGIYLLRVFICLLVQCRGLCRGPPLIIFFFLRFCRLNNPVAALGIRFTRAPRLKSLEISTPWQPRLLRIPCFFLFFSCFAGGIVTSFTQRDWSISRSFVCPVVMGDMVLLSNFRDRNSSVLVINVVVVYFEVYRCSLSLQGPSDRFFFTVHLEFFLFWRVTYF